jgi:hypothetical protein
MWRGTPRQARKFFSSNAKTKRAAYKHEESIMQVLKPLLTVCGFAACFAGMVTLSAITTSIVHSAVSPRPALSLTVGD